MVDIVGFLVTISQPLSSNLLPNTVFYSLKKPIN